MAEDYSWDTPIKELWEKAAKNPPEVPHYQKLITLARLKSANHLTERTANLAEYTKSLAKYTKWQMVVTFVLAFCALLQIALVLLRH